MPLALPAVMIAVILLVLAFAFVLVVEATVGRVLGGAPIVGPWLSGRVVDAALSAYAGIVSTIVQGTAGMVSTFAYPILQLHSLIDNIGAAAEGGVLAAETLRGYTIPLVVSQLTSLAYAVRDQAIAQAAVYQQQVVGLVWAVKTIIDGEIATQVSNLSGLVWAVKGIIDGEITSAFNLATQYAHDAAGAAWTHADQVQAWAEAYAGAQAATALQAAEGQIAGLDRTIEGELQVLKGYVDAQTGAVSAQDRAALGALSATLGASIAGVATAVQDLERLPCIQECSTLGPFASMLDDIDLAAILALTAAALADPSATTTFVQDQVVPVIQDAGGTAVQLLGLGQGVTA